MTDRAISPPGSPLRRRMIEDMTIRELAPKTQASYIRAVRNFSLFLGRSPESARAEDLRRYQFHMRSSGASATSMNAAVSALRFFFAVTLGRSQAATWMTTVREPRKLPVVLSLAEVALLLAQVQGGAERGLRRRPARRRGGLAQALGYRQPAHGDPSRARQGA